MRYLPQTQNSREAMLEKCGYKNVDELYRDVPQKAFVKGVVDLPMHQGELEVERYMGAYANENHAAVDGPFFLAQERIFIISLPVWITLFNALSS